VNLYKRQRKAQFNEDEKNNTTQKKKNVQGKASGGGLNSDREGIKTFSIPQIIPFK